MNRQRDVSKYVHMRLAHTSLNLIEFVPDAGDYVHLREWPPYSREADVNGMIARFPTKEAFDQWVDHQRSKNMTKAELLAMGERILDGMHMEGSGFDADDSVEAIGPRVYYNGSFHCMNQHGYYDGWIEFRVRWHVGLGPFDYRVYVMGRDSHNAAKRHYGTREFIEETVNNAVNDALPAWWNKIVWPGEKVAA